MSTTTKTAMFDSISPAPPDAILGLTEAFKADSNPKKINLGVGIYQDETGKTPVLQSVKDAEASLVSEEATKSYLPITGSPEYGQLVRGMLFGEGSDLIGNGLAQTAHTPGGTGALRVGADFLKKFSPEANVWVSTPTWANHKGIFTAAGVGIKDYPYYDKATRGVDFDGMIAALNKVPAGDIVLLHVCCHNPTGVDLSADQWQQVAQCAADKGWIPFLDFAYQGFGESIEKDREAVVAMANSGSELLIASSFSKNFGLYRERTGALTIVGVSKEGVSAAFSHIKKTIRVNYSNPPAHGGLIVKTILESDALRAAWVQELAAMRERIKSTRTQFVDALKARNVDQDFSFIADQRGMFSFSGLSDEHVAFLGEKKSIYIVKGGRINVAGITPSNIDYLCDSIAEALS